MALPMAGESWGQEIEVEHRYAIVFAAEMSREMIAPAPHSPSPVESMHKYVDGAVIANQVALFVANLGYSATSNHLSHYDGLMVPLAVDAGLGEVGRLGYLMTKEFGPRQRLSAVTTDLPLVPDGPVDIGVHDFCRAAAGSAQSAALRSPFPPATRKRSTDRSAGSSTRSRVSITGPRSEPTVTCV